MDKNRKVVFIGRRLKDRLRVTTVQKKQSPNNANDALFAFCIPISTFQNFKFTPTSRELSRAPISDMHNVALQSKVKPGKASDNKRINIEFAKASGKTLAPTSGLANS